MPLMKMKKMERGNRKNKRIAELEYRSVIHLDCTGLHIVHEAILDHNSSKIGLLAIHLLVEPFVRLYPNRHS